MSVNQAFASSASAAHQPIEIETPRLMLREHKQTDVDRIHEITSAPGFFYFCFDGSRAKAEEFIDEAIRTQVPDPVEGRRANHMLAIYLKDTGELVGHTCMERVHYVNGADYEVNFFVDPKYQNKGYGIEAILNLTDWGYKTYNLPSMTVTVDPSNGPSRHLIVKEGYRKVSDISMKTTRGVEPRELFIMTQAEFYQSRARDTRPILLSQVGKINPPAPKAP